MAKKPTKPKPKPSVTNTSAYLNAGVTGDGTSQRSASFGMSELSPPKQSASTHSKPKTLFGLTKKRLTRLLGIPSTRTS